MTAGSLKTVTFTLDSMERCLIEAIPSDWCTLFTVPEDGSWGVLRQVMDGHCFVLDPGAQSPRSRVVILLGTGAFFEALSASGRITALKRMHRLAVHASRRQLRFPHAWGQYTADNLITVFAYPPSYGSERVVAEIEGDGVTDTFFCAATTDASQLNLESFRPDRAPFLEAIHRYAAAAADIVQRFQGLAHVETPGVIDLKAVAHGAVTAGRTYSAWIPSLSEQQQSFVFRSPDRSVKLRGPAGSGKTVAMELKALRECYEAEDAGEDLRVLYVTHSWGVAEQVQESLDCLDERRVLERIDVFPLVTLAQGELERTGKVRILGDDSFSGKELQLKTLAHLVDEARRGDWIAYASSCSDSFVARVEAPAGTTEANRFLWDLMLEFACVIGANGILPGLNADRRYREIERRPWMMPLAIDAEKSFVFLIYSRMVQGLLEREEMTTDQVINDYLNLLSTYRWHSDRRKRGYDLVFVDEFHLFNEQERMVFHHLTRDPDAYPIIFMAMDPRQSPAETYAEFAASGVASRESGAVDRSLVDYGSIDLRVVYRYTPEILRFLQHLDKFYPALNLGVDSQFDLADSRTERTSGETPILRLHSSASDERTAAMEDAVGLAAGGGKVALLCLDNESFRDYRSAGKSSRRARFEVVESREDVEKLGYTRRSIVISQPHYVAGLQFDAVVVGGCRPQFSQYDPYQAYGLRRFLSDLYLGASRARDVLHIHASGSSGDFPPVLEAAVKDGAILLDGDKLRA